MKTKSQIAIFIALAMFVVFIILFAVYYMVSSAANIKRESPMYVGDLSGYLEECYKGQQSCALKIAANMKDSPQSEGITGNGILKISDIQAYTDIDSCKARLEAFLAQKSKKCSDELPDELASKYSFNSAAQANIIFAESNTAVHTIIKQKIRKGSSQLDNIEFYDSHLPRFKLLHSHATAIKQSNKVMFDYLKNVPVNQTVYKEESSKKYVLDDPYSYNENGEFLMLFLTD